ncbi:hypothetical protein HYDPIDRAFT_165217 [Hydnomerulius pinastri MD-312]|nr:hypothetical protein HYDPIDRAFT_165217 [Hydnomerulius pinastri MD-312]
MSYPLEWLKTSFPSRERTIELLQPELDANVLSPHDYEIATRFLPGSHRRWPVIYGGGVSGAAFGYGYFMSRPRWTPFRLALTSAAGFMLGMSYGVFREFMAHYQFANSLEDPQGFMTALNHVDKKLGGTGNIGFTLQRIRRESLETMHDPNQVNASQGPEMVREADWTQQQDGVDVNESTSSETGPADVKSRWEEIRVANARNVGKQSSWDALRQRQERSKLPKATSPTREVTTPDGADERAAAQASFDALLEAERRKGQTQDDRNFV